MLDFSGFAHAQLLRQEFSPENIAFKDDVNAVAFSFSNAIMRKGSIFEDFSLFVTSDQKKNEKTLVDIDCAFDELPEILKAYCLLGVLIISVEDDIQKIFKNFSLKVEGDFEPQGIMTRFNAPGGTFYYVISIVNDERMKEEFLRNPEAIRHVFFHETGHFVDEVLGKPSQSDAFLKALKKDCNLLLQNKFSELLKEIFQYYLPKEIGDLGDRETLEDSASEVFAEICANIFNRNELKYNLSKFMPYCAEIIDQHIAHLKKMDASLVLNNNPHTLEKPAGPRFR